MKPWQPWLPLLGVGAVAAAAGVAAALSLRARAWLDHWLWQPIVGDLGYNAVNTAVLVVLMAAGLAWLGLLFRHYGEQVDAQTAGAGLLFFSWGVSLRVFEDADLFAPFAHEVAAAGGTPGATCLPDPQAFSDCAGVLFVTPLLWLWLAFVMWGIARVGLHVQWAGDRLGQGVAQRRTRVFLAALALLLSLPWLARPSWLAAAPNPLGPWIAAAGAAFVLSRLSRLRWSHLLAAGSAILLGASASLLVAWFFGGSGTWVPDGDVRGYLVPWCAAAVAAVVALRWAAARRLAAGPPRPPEAPAGAAPWLLLYLDLAAAALAFAALAGVVLWHEGRGSLAALWPAALLALIVPAARQLGRKRGDPRLAIAGSGVGLLMLGGQAADALVTAIGLDVLGAGEKHIVPRTLIGMLQGIPLPAPFAAYPAATVLILTKMAIVVLATWMVGVRAPQWWDGWAEGRRLLLLGVGFIGAAPALRNLLRMAMGV